MSKTEVADVPVETTPQKSQDRSPTAPLSSGEFLDEFTDARRPGHVIGTKLASGVTRKGVDREGVISIDNGALRIHPLVKSRWGRAGIAYGPYQRKNGLAFGAFILNGHNTSQTGPIPDSLTDRLKRWALGSETEPRLTRLVRWARSGQRKYAWRHFLQWAISGSRYLQTVTVDENLAVGWFPREVPSSPLNEGNSLIMHAVGPECGELWARVGSGTLRSVRGIQNVQMYYFVVLRDRGAAYYAASIAGVPGFEAYPMMTPIAIDPFHTDQTVYAGVHQSVLGQIGFRAETRLYSTQVATLPGYDQWFGSASGADHLTGNGPLERTQAATGGVWCVWEGELQRSPKGILPIGRQSSAVLPLSQPAGLLHAVVETDHTPVEGVALLFRVKDRNNFWAFEVGTRECTLLVTQAGVVSRFPSTRTHYLAPFAANSIQVSDDGEAIRLYVNGELVYGTQLLDARLNDALGVGFRHPGNFTKATIRDLEAHPRMVPVPRPLSLGEAWHPTGDRVVVSDDFDAPEADLSGRSLPSSPSIWRKEIGTGEFRLTGSRSVRVVGSAQSPSPGRSAYTIPWQNPVFADVSVQITPPGTSRDTGEKGRGGLIFWQDERNYITLTVFVDDWYGTSIAAFFYRDGYEELYDAVWTNIGRRVHWGMPYDFRVVFDSQHFMAYVNDEPVLYRTLQDIYPDWSQLPINRIGLVANWEWGSDTGSTFRNFRASDLG